MDIEYKFDYRYNPKSNRLEDYDYSENGGYFITICCKDRVEYFGEIVEGEMILNEYGKIVEEDILNLKKYYNNIIIPDFVVMPDHIHFNIFIENNIDLKDVVLKDVVLKDVDLKDVDLKDVVLKDVSEKHLYSNNSDEKFSQKYYSNISPKKGELGNIIKLFKGYLTKKLNKIDDKIFFAWQNNYYDRIIRNKEEYIKIKKYIKNNPKNWTKEKNNKQGILM